MAGDGTKIDLVNLKMDFAWKMPKVQLKGRDLTNAQDAANNAVVAGIYGGMRLASEAVKPALNEAMAQSVWRWPNVTIRRNSSDVGAPRDIVDTTNLRDSMDTSHVNNTFTITYTAPYANMVHYGGITRPYGRGGDSFVYPARPWISSMFSGSNGIEKFPLMDIVDKNVKKEWADRYSGKLFKL